MWGYVIIFLAAFIETALGIGLLLPGSTIVLLAGVGAANGSIHFWGLVPAVALGATLGDNLNYYLGSTYGRRWIERKLWILTPTHFATGKRFVDHHGAKSVLIGRFIPTIKEIVPFIAGVLHMDRKTFMIYNILGAFGWALEWLGAGYFFGHALGDAQNMIVRVQIIAGVLLLGFVIYYTMRVRIHKTL